MLCKETQRGRGVLWYNLPPVNSLMVMHPLLRRPATGTRPLCGTRWAHQTFYHRISVLLGDRADKRSVVPPLLCNVFGSTVSWFCTGEEQSGISFFLPFKVFWEAKSSNLVSTSRLIVDSRRESPLLVNWFTKEVLGFSFSLRFSRIFSPTLLWRTLHSVWTCKTRPTFKAALSLRNTQRSKLLRHPPEQRGFLIIRILKSHFWCSVIVPSTTLLRFVEEASMEAVSPSLPNS